MTVDEQEALSRKYSNDVIILLPLRSGNVAVFNSHRELCGYCPPDMEQIEAVWYPPKERELLSRNEIFDEINLEELGL